jgi:hypothetical protein
MSGIDRNNIRNTTGTALKTAFLVFGLDSEGLPLASKPCVSTHGQKQYPQE